MILNGAATAGLYSIPCRWWCRADSTAEYPDPEGGQSLIPQSGSFLVAIFAKLFQAHQRLEKLLFWFYIDPF